MIDERLQKLREIMLQHNIDACIFPTNDPHFSEYPTDHWKIREWISGFTGSAGTVAITQNHAGLWTDSRYFISAEKELATSSFELHKVTDRSQPGYVEFLYKNLERGNTVSINGEVLSKNAFQKMERVFDKKDIKLSLDQSFVDALWTTRPSLPKDMIFIHEDKYAGLSREQKLSAIRDIIKDLDGDAYLISALDEIAWVLNLRGSDTENNPVFVSYLLIEDEQATLFIDEAKLSTEISSILNESRVMTAPYSSLFTHLTELPSQTTLVVDQNSLNMRSSESLQHLEITHHPSIIRKLKAIKNETEIGHFKNAMVKDGVALVHTFKWLEDTLKERTVSEYTLGKKLTHFRSQQSNFKGESFSPIVGFNGNGAIVHYRAPEEGSAEIDQNGILLVDSGGQYIDGTTDITRTFATGMPDQKVIDINTYVLKGHVALSKALFPSGTKGVQLDVFARQYLWEKGLNFSHGTGHGVGFFLNVHEGPQGISPAITSLGGQTVFEPGMVTSNEPGYYEEEAFGIRIENLILCKESENKSFLTFETITYFPYDDKLINPNLLSNEEIEWINNYHETVYNQLAPHLDEEHSLWLKDKCVKF